MFSRFDTIPACDS